MVLEENMEDSSSPQGFVTLMVDVKRGSLHP